MTYKNMTLTGAHFLTIGCSSKRKLQKSAKAAQCCKSEEIHFSEVLYSFICGGVWTERSKSYSCHATYGTQGCVCLCVCKCVLFSNPQMTRADRDTAEQTRPADSQLYNLINQRMEISGPASSTPLKINASERLVHPPPWPSCQLDSTCQACRRLKATGQGHKTDWYSRQTDKVEDPHTHPLLWIWYTMEGENAKKHVHVHLTCASRMFLSQQTTTYVNKVKSGYWPN